MIELHCLLCPMIIRVCKFDKHREQSTARRVNVHLLNHHFDLGMRARSLLADRIVSAAS